MTYIRSATDVFSLRRIARMFYRNRPNRREVGLFRHAASVEVLEQRTLMSANSGETTYVESNNPNAGQNAVLELKLEWASLRTKERSITSRSTSTITSGLLRGAA